MSEPNGDKDFYRDMTREMVAIAKDNARQVQSNNKIMGDLVNVIGELKIALQSKPCLVEKCAEEVNKGWKDKTLGIYQFVIVALFSVLIGVLTAFGLYK